MVSEYYTQAYALVFNNMQAPRNHDLAINNSPPFKGGVLTGLIRHSQRAGQVTLNPNKIPFSVTSEFL